MKGQPGADNTMADGDLVEAAVAGDRRAVEALVRRLTPIVQARITRLLLGRTREARDLRRDVEDHTQDLLTQLFTDRGRLLRDWRSEGGLSLDNFVGLVAERRTISTLRSGRRNPWREESASDALPDAGDGAPGPDREAAGREELGRLLEGLEAKLSPLGFTLFQLLYVEELETDEVCERTQLSADAVYAWRSRLRRTAREVYGALVSDGGASPRIPPGGLTT
jgi:RNA polymerase sigma-70 factor (ECF subfamily)